MDISYDPAKRDWTLRTRGLDFAQAGKVFDTVNMTAEESSRDYGERRYKTIGLLDGQVVALVWTERGNSVRIISMRKANGYESATFSRYLGRSG